MLILFLLSVAFASPGEAQLAREIKTISLDAHGRVGVACSLPGSTLDCDLNPKARLPMQSVYKFPIAMAVLHAVEQSKLSLTDNVKFVPADLISPGQHSPLRDVHPQANVDVRLSELLRLAVSESDGVASDILLRTVGGPAVVDQYVRDLRISGMQIKDGEKAIGRDPRVQYRNYAEPQAMVDLLRRLADRSPFTAAHTAFLIKLMTETETGPRRIKGLLPAGTIVAHKTGTSGQDGGVTHATNDVGLITLPDGRLLAVAVMVVDSPASESIREGVIARIARAIYNAAASPVNAR